MGCWNAKYIRGGSFGNPKGARNGWSDRSVLFPTLQYDTLVNISQIYEDMG
jgi:hypothetical protein